LVLGSSSSLGEAVSRIVSNSLGQLMANVPCVLQGEDPEGPHQIRVAARRLRSAFALFRPLFTISGEAGEAPLSTLASFEEETRRVADLLGPLRDWDVLLQELLPPVQAASAFSPELGADLEALMETAGRRRREALDTVRETLATSSALTVLALKLLRWLDGLEAPEERSRLGGSAKAYAHRALARRHAQVLKLGRSLAETDEERLHELRIGLKKLRYAAEFFQGLFPDSEVRRLLRHLGRMQDALGGLNDVATARRLLMQLGSPSRRAGVARTARGSGLLLGWHLGKAEGARKRFRKDWKKFRHLGTFWEK
jgi:CHAD domain-containing protein